MVKLGTETEVGAGEDGDLGQGNYWGDKEKWSGFQTFRKHLQE